MDAVFAVLPDGLEGAYLNKTPVVHECEIHWCVKKLQSTLLNGKLDEQTLEILDMESQDLGNKAWAYNPLISTSTPVTYYPNFTLTLPDIDSNMANFALSNRTARKTIQLLDELAPASLTGAKYISGPCSQMELEGDSTTSDSSDGFSKPMATK